MMNFRNIEKNVIISTIADKFINEEFPTAYDDCALTPSNR